MTGSRSRWPCRSIASTSFGINAFSRLPQTRSAASHNTVRACRTASSYNRLRSSVPLCCTGLLPQQPDSVLAMIPGQSYELVENPDPVAERRAAATAIAVPATNSLRVVMLLWLVTFVPLQPDNPTGSKLREATGQRELQF